MSNEKNQDLPSISPEQEAAIADVKTVLASKQDVLMAIGQVQAFNNMRKYATVAELITYRKIKESKQYKGLVYENENGESATVADIKEICTVFFGRSYRAMQEDEQNLTTFGEEFFESSKSMGLGTRELRKLRQLPSETQELIINSESVDLNDKEAIKELIEDEAFKHATELAEAKKRAEDAEETVEAVRENSAVKQQELDQAKEREAKRRFSQEPWKHQTIELAQGMLQARVLVEQGVNQLTEIFQQITAVESTLDEKAINYLARSIFSEATNVNDLVYNLTSEVSGLLSTNFKADVDAVDVLEELSETSE